MSEQTKISRLGGLRAAAAGGQAFRDGKTIKDCPHPVGGDVGDEFMAHYWVKGFNAAAEQA